MCFLTVHNTVGAEVVLSRQHPGSCTRSGNMSLISGGACSAITVAAQRQLILGAAVKGTTKLPEHWYLGINLRGMWLVSKVKC